MNRTIGDFELLGELGRGGMGVVYRARHRILGQDVALKVMLGVSASQEALERFLREARTSAQLEHSGIVRVHHAGWSGPNPYLVIDYVEGGSLKDRLEQDGGRLLPREAARIVARLAEALAHAHARRVLHRDIKPANVLLTESGEPLLTDFGLAKDLQASQQLTRTGQLLGTPEYMAPEQLDGVRSIGPPADVYGLGATLYHLLAGRTPYVGSALEIISAVTRGKSPGSLRNEAAIDPALASLCERCLATDPGQRPTAEELAADLGRWLDGELAAPARGGRRGASVVVAAVLGAVVLAAVGVAAALGLPIGLGGGPPSDWFVELPAEHRPPWPSEVDPFAFDAERGVFHARVDPSVELLWVPPGRFRFGADGSEVDVAGFLIGRHEVSWAQYDRFVAATGHPPPLLERPDRDDLPVAGVFWYDALLYARWLGLTLPSEPEWEHAAQGPVGAGGSERTYPWGEDPAEGWRCVFDEGGGAAVAPVVGTGEHVSITGAHHMAGNVAEWALAPWPEMRLPVGSLEEVASLQVPVRGGSFRSPADGVRCVSRQAVPAYHATADVGLRVAWSSDGIRRTADRSDGYLAELRKRAVIEHRAILPWRRLALEGEPLPPRSHAHAVYDPEGDRVLIFGGRTGYGKHKVKNDLFILADGRIAAAPVGDALPPGRYGAGMAWDAARGCLVLYGGKVVDKETLGDLWEWTDAGGWRLRFQTEVDWRSPLREDGSYRDHPGDPGTRHGHRMTWDPRLGHVLVTAGRAVDGVLIPNRRDVWVWHGDEEPGRWERMPDLPGPNRQTHGQLDDGEATWLYGGRSHRDEDPNDQVFLDDLFRFDGASRRWTALEASGEAPVDLDFEHTLLADGDGVALLYGKKGEGGWGTWLFEAGRFTRRRPTEQPERVGPALVVDRRRGVALLIGGALTDGTWTVLDEVWAYDLEPGERDDR